MKTTILILASIIIGQVGFSQTKNYIDQPFLETSASVDTMVTPDRIYLTIIINEADSKNKVSVEELENSMAGVLKESGVEIKKQLTLSDMSSNFKKYFLKQKDILKYKTYVLEVYDAVTAGGVISGLESVGISNVNVDRVEYSAIESIKIELRSKAVLKAKAQADAMLLPLKQKTGSAIFISDGYSNVNYNSRIIAEVQYAPATRQKVKPIDIDFEKIKIQSEISVKFKIE